MSKFAKIALTGGIACGKSLVARFLNELGVETLDADDVVHGLIPADERKRLARTVFADPVARKALESRIHPIVRKRIGEFFDSSNRRFVDCGVTDGMTARPIERLDNQTIAQSPQSIDESTNRKIEKFRVAIIPLLFEVRWEGDFDRVICIVSKREVQVERIMTTRGYTRAEAEARLAAQLPVTEKAAKSHYVIENDGSAEALRLKVFEMVNWIKKEEQHGRRI